MNTVVCDADTSELADTLGPVIVMWLERFGGDWREARYVDGMRYIENTWMGSDWCLSELLPFWAEDRQPEYETEFYHEDCPWQP